MAEFSQNQNQSPHGEHVQERVVDPSQQTVDLETDSSNPLDEMIDRWIDDRTSLVFSRDEDGKIPHRKIATCDNAFVEEMSGGIPAGDQTKVLSSLMRHAQDRCYWAEQQLIVDRVEEGSAIREEIEAKIIDRWQEIGWYRAQRNGRENVAHLEEPYFKQKRQFFSDMLTRQFEQLLGGNTSAVRKIVDESIDGISQKAEQIGIKRYLEAEQTAINLYKNLPGRAKNNHELFTTLAELAPEQREDALRAFKNVFGDSFDKSFEDASNNLLSQLFNFARIPALRAALEERFGIGVGLLKAGGHILPHPKNWIAMLGQWGNNAVVFVVAVRKVLIPRIPSMRSFKKWSTLKEESIEIWKEYTGQLSSFLTDLTTRVAKPQEARVKALLAGDKAEACVHSFLLLLWGNDEKMRDVLVSLLSELSTEERLSIESNFKELYGAQVGDRTLREALSLYLSEEDAGVIEAHLDGNPELALSRILDSKLAQSRGTRVELLQDLSQRTPYELLRIATRFTEDNGVTLNREYLSQHLEGPMLDWAEALFDGRPIEAASARLQCALKRISREWPEVIFYDHKHQERSEIIARTEQRYEIDFWARVRKQRGREATEILKVFIEKGELELFHQVRHCMIGHGNDVESLLAILADRKPKRIEQMIENYNNSLTRRDFSPINLLEASFSSAGTLLRTASFKKVGETFAEQTTTQRDLFMDIDNELCGEERFDVLRLLEGRTTKADVLYERFLERYNFDHAITDPERPYSLTSSESRRNNQDPTLYEQAKALFLEIYPQNTLLETINIACDDVHLFYQEHIQNKEYTDQERKTLAALIQRAELGLATYRDFTSKKANTYVNLGAIGTCSLATYGVIWMSLPYIPSGIVVGTASLAGRMLMKSIFKGQRYGWRESFGDFGFAIIDGGTVAWGTIVRTAARFRFLGAFGRTIFRITSKFIIKKSLQELNEAQIKHIIMRSKESIHSRRHLETEKDLFLAEYGKLLHKEREKVIVGRMAAPRQSESIENIFRRVGKKLISEQGSSEDVLAPGSTD